MSKTVQITIRMAPELWHMTETAIMKGKFRNMNEFLRACVRFYIDETDDVMGSSIRKDNALIVGKIRALGKCIARFSTQRAIWQPLT